jgi:hypothetical protein
MEKKEDTKAPTIDAGTCTGKGTETETESVAKTSASEVKPKDRLDACLGCVLGAFMGDAAGAPLEFLTKTRITPQRLEEALAMKGGGCWKVGPGQITDDSEMAMALARGLNEGKDKLNPNLLAKFYGAWIESPPFGIITIDSLQTLATPHEMPWEL